MATDEADSDNKFSPEDNGDEDKENNEADVEFEFEMKSDSDSDRLRPGCHRSDTTVNSALFISLKVSPLFHVVRAASDPDPTLST